MAQAIFSQEKILRVVGKSVRGLTAGQISARTRVNLKTVSNLLPILARKGLIDYS